MFRRLLFVFLVGAFLFPLLTVNAQGINLVAQTTAPGLLGMDIYGITILVLLGIVAVLLLALVRQSGTIKDLLPAEVVQAIVGVVVDVTKQTSTPLDDKVAETILKPLVERILAESAPDIFRDLPELPSEGNSHPVN